jgi:hypothetical protein
MLTVSGFLCTLDRLLIWYPVTILRNPLTSLGDYLDPELISRCLAEAGTVTLRKRRLPLEMMVWCIVGMALERKEPFIRSSTVWTSCCRAVVPSSPPAR